MATKFADIAKPAGDLLGDDYTNKFSLKCKKNAGPVAVTIETERDQAGALSSKVGTKASYAKFSIDKGQIKADGGQVLETSLKVSPEIKLTFKSNKGADLGVDYVKGNFYATGVLDVMEMSKFSTSVCLGLPSGIKAGGDATYSLSGASGLTGFNVGASYTAGPVFTSLTATSKLSQFNLGILYKVNDDISVASQTVHSSSKVCTCLGVGGAYKIASVGTVKAKFGGGNISACVVREVAPKVSITASGSVSASDFSTFKPGIAITM